MKNRQILTALVLLLLFLPLVAFAAEPTAIVIDTETGAPVEGAVVLAQWHKPVALGLGLGATQALEKALEAFSDKDGKVNIEGLWGAYVFSQKPRLTVYKPGYVIWDSQEICPFGKRTDFDTKHRTVKLLKFETEAARWLREKYDEGRGKPRAMQNSCFNSWYSSTAGTKFNVNFMDIFYKHEKPLIDKEEMDRRIHEKK